MKLRWYLAFWIFCAACAPVNQPPSNIGEGTTPGVKIISTQKYTVKQTISLDNTGERSPEKQNLWVALIRDLPPYQEVLSRRISPKKYILSTDEYGNEYAEFDLVDHPAGTRIDIVIAYEVSVNELDYDLTN